MDPPHSLWELHPPGSLLALPSTICLLPPGRSPLAPVFPDCPPLCPSQRQPQTSSDHTLQAAHWGSQTSQGECVRRRPQWCIWALWPPHLCPLQSTKEAQSVHRGRREGRMPPAQSKGPNAAGPGACAPEPPSRDFPGGAVHGHPPANAGHTDLIPGPGRFHLPWSN